VELLVKRRKGVDITKGMLKGGKIEYRIENIEFRMEGIDDNGVITFFASIELLLRRSVQRPVTR